MRVKKIKGETQLSRDKPKTSGDKREISFGEVLQKEIAKIKRKEQNL